MSKNSFFLRLVNSIRSNFRTNKKFSNNISNIETFPSEQEVKSTAIPLGDYIEVNELLRAMELDAMMSTHYSVWDAVKCIKSQKIADVVPRCVLNTHLNKLNDYRRVCGDLVVFNDTAVGVLIDSKVEYVNKNIAHQFKQMAVKRAQLDLLDSIFTEIDRITDLYATGAVNEMEMYELIEKLKEESKQNLK